MYKRQNERDPALKRVIQRGCWSEKEWFGGNAKTGWTFSGADNDGFNVFFEGNFQGTVNWELTGEHNCLNALDVYKRQSDYRGCQ